MSDQKSTANEDLPKETIIIVGCVCGAVVIILTIVLIVLCCKRQQNKQQYEKQQENRMSPVVGGSPEPESYPKQVNHPGQDNPGMDQTDHSAIEMNKIQSGSVTSTAAHGPNISNHWQNPPSYDNVRNEQQSHDERRNASHNLDQHHNDGHRSDNYRNDHRNSQRQDAYYPEPAKPPRESHEHSNEQPKPKKVIYEVVV